MRLHISILILLLVATLAPGDDKAAADREKVERAVELYEDKKYQESLELFRGLTREAPGDPLPIFNSLTLEARTRQLATAESYLKDNPDTPALDADQRGKALYNLGTAYLKNAEQMTANGNFKEANLTNEQLSQAEFQLQRAQHWLRQSLIGRPEGLNTKTNLELANQLMKKLQEEKQKNEQQQQQQGEEQQPNSNEGNEQENSQEKRQDQSGENQQNQQQQGDEENDQQQGRPEKNQQDSSGQEQDNQNKDKQKGEERSISPEVAENLLNAAREQEKEALKAIRELKAKKNKGKDGKDY